MAEVYMMGNMAEGWGERMVYRSPHLLSGLLLGGSRVAIVARPEVIHEIIDRYCAKAPCDMVFYPRIDAAVEDLRKGVMDSCSIVVDPDMHGSDEFLFDQTLLDMKSGARERVGALI